MPDRKFSTPTEGHPPVCIVTSRDRQKNPGMANNLDAAALLSIAKNRSRLMKLAEGIKTRKKPGCKKSINLKLDPAYTNIEHLVFGTYRQRSSTPDPRSEARRESGQRPQPEQYPPEHREHRGSARRGSGGIPTPVKNSTASTEGAVTATSPTLPRAAVGGPVHPAGQKAAGPLPAKSGSQRSAQLRQHAPVNKNGGRPCGGSLRIPVVDPRQEMSPQPAPRQPAVTDFPKATPSLEVSSHAGKTKASPPLDLTVPVEDFLGDDVLDCSSQFSGGSQEDWPRDIHNHSSDCASSVGSSRRADRRRRVRPTRASTARTPEETGKPPLDPANGGVRTWGTPLTDVVPVQFEGIGSASGTGGAAAPSGIPRPRVHVRRSEGGDAGFARSYSVGATTSPTPVSLPPRVDHMSPQLGASPLFRKSASLSEKGKTGKLVAAPVISDSVATRRREKPDTGQACTGVDERIDGRRTKTLEVSSRVSGGGTLTCRITVSPPSRRHTRRRPGLSDHRAARGADSRDKEAPSRRKSFSGTSPTPKDGGDGPSGTCGSARIRSASCTRLVRSLSDVGPGEMAATEGGSALPSETKSSGSRRHGRTAERKTSRDRGPRAATPASRIPGQRHKTRGATTISSTTSFADLQRGKPPTPPVVSPQQDHSDGESFMEDSGSVLATQDVPEPEVMTWKSVGKRQLGVVVDQDVLQVSPHITLPCLAEVLTDRNLSPDLGLPSLENGSLAGRVTEWNAAKGLKFTYIPPGDRPKRTRSASADEAAAPAPAASRLPPPPPPASDATYARLFQKLTNGEEELVGGEEIPEEKVDARAFEIWALQKLTAALCSDARTPAETARLLQALYHRLAHPPATAAVSSSSSCPSTLNAEPLSDRDPGEASKDARPPLPPKTTDSCRHLRNPEKPTPLWMSDIEEKDENSSSSAGREIQEELPETAADRFQPPRPRTPGARSQRTTSQHHHHHHHGRKRSGESLGLERLLPVGPPATEPDPTDAAHPADGQDWSDSTDLENAEPHQLHCSLLNNRSSSVSLGEEGTLASDTPESSHRSATDAAFFPGLIRNRPISRSERHLKVGSVPDLVEDALIQQRRPWSQVYGDGDAQGLLGQQSSNLGPGSIQRLKEVAGSSMPSLDSGGGTRSGGFFFGRNASLRSIGLRSLPADGVLQKFRKSFSLRFQKGRRLEQPVVVRPAGENDSTPPSRLLQKANSLPASGNVDDGTAPLEDVPALHPMLRSSKERRRGRKLRKDPQGSKCSSADSGIQVELLYPSSEGTTEASSAGNSPALIRRRAASASESSPKVKQPQRPHSDLGGSIGRSNGLGENSTTSGDEQSNDEKRASLDLEPSELFRPLHKTPSMERQLSTPPPIKERVERSRPRAKKGKGRSRLRRSISQPLDLEKLGLGHKVNQHQGLSDREGSREPSIASSDEEFSSDGEGFHSLYSTTRIQPSLREMYEDNINYAEALWDHMTLDSEELPFRAGEVIEVTDSSDKDWWWGSIGDRSGWFPAAFVRLRVNQDDTVEDCIIKMSDGTLTRQMPRKMSVSLLSNEQVRANVVREIVTTEQDFVQHLRDVVEGYLRQVRRRPDMFAEECITTMFGNIEAIYSFQSNFLKALESSIDWENPHLSQIGNCFLQHKDEFKIYSLYCNNHPLAVSELQELYADPKYIHFFEACRLLQEMIDISLDGFLLTPVQKICKYPLQLAELLKYTKPDHPDFDPVGKALAAMREVAQMVNERKRRMECLERLAEWQRSVDGWEGPDLLDTSSILIHSGEVTRVSPGWSWDHTLFLLDHVLIYCKKDLLKRNTYVYKGRIDMDTCCVFDVEDGRESRFGVNVKNAFKMYCASRDKWFLFYTKSKEEKYRWLNSFREERDRVREDQEQGFVVTEQDKKAARLALMNKLKPKRPRAKVVKGPHPDTAVAEVLLDPPVPKARTSSLPSNLHPGVMVMAGTNQEPPKKKGSGWFHFGSGKKQKK